MHTSTYSQNLDKNDKRPSLSVCTSQGLDADYVIVVIGPLGGPFQHVYLTPTQARQMGEAFVQMADEVQS